MKIFTLNNKICDIGIKYLGQGLSKLNNLNNLTLYLYLDLISFKLILLLYIIFIKICFSNFIIKNKNNEKSNNK